MTFFGRHHPIAVAAWLALGTLCHGQEPIKLLKIEKLSRTADALPRIANPSEAQARINRAFIAFDVRAREQVNGCQGRSKQGDEMFFKRSIAVMSQGSLFLSLEVTEEAGCGGVHPYFNRFTLSYNLQTGEQARWVRFLTRGRAREVTVSPNDGVFFSLLGVKSLPLQKLYIAGWKDKDGCTIDYVLDPADETDENLTTFQLSAAPHQSGLSVLPADLASAAATCALPVILGKSAMEKLGIAEDLQQVLLAAH